MPRNLFDYAQLAADYARHRYVQPAVLAALLAGTQPHSQSTVVEIGCGTGNYIGAVQEATGCTALGVEPADAMLAVARTRHPAVRFIQAQAEAPALVPAAADAVFSVDVIHHVPDVAAFFAAALAALRPGGLLCTATDSPEMIARRRPLADYFPATVAADRTRYPAPELLQRAMTSAGLVNLRTQEVRHTYRLHDAAPYRNRAYSCLHLISPAEFADGLARMEADLQAGPLEASSEYLLLWAARPE